MHAFTHTLRTESLEATFRTSPHLLGVSLRHRGVELLREIDHVEQSAIQGHPCGVPLLHPWANRLARHGYRAAGADVSLDMHSPLLRGDERGLPLHGVPWSLVHTVAPAGGATSCSVQLDWHDAALLDVFPFEHSLTVRASVHGSALTIATELLATGSRHVPLAFGFHPYLGLPTLPRDAWRVELPARVQMQLDTRGLPTGESRWLAASMGALGTASHDDAFALAPSSDGFSIADGMRRISVVCVEGYTHVQLYAPPDRDFVCIEPMTAPVNALCSGDGLRTVAPGERFTATFRIVVEDLAE